MRKSWQFVGLALVLSATMFMSACTTKSVVTVNGKKITQKEFDKRFEQLKAYAEQSGATFEGEVGQYMLAGLEREALDALEQEVMIMDAANKEKIEIKDEEVDKYIKERKEQSFKTDKEYKDFLQKNKMTDKDLEVAIKYQLTGQKLYEHITKNVTVTDADVKEYFDQNKAQFKPRVKVSHILIKADELTEKAEIAKAQEKAEGIIKQLNSGADFKKLAGQYSEDPGSKDNGGYFDFAFSEDEQNVDEVFRKASFTLEKVGDITQVPVKSQFGFHIIKLEEKLDDVKAMETEIKVQALQAKKNNFFQEYLEKIKKEANIKETFQSKYASDEWKKQNNPENTKQEAQNANKQPQNTTDPHKNVDPNPSK